MGSDNGIKINRNQRRWHKYGKIITGVSIAAAAGIVAIAVSVSAASTGKKNNIADAVMSQTEASQADVPETDIQETATRENNIIKLDGKPEKVELGTGDTFAKSVFIGDVFVYGLKDYGMVDADNLWTSTYMPVNKAAKYVEDVADMKPDRLFIMLGFDDIVSDADVSAKACASDITELIKSFEKALPETKIFFLSNMPVTEEYDKSSSNDAKQKTLDEINDLILKGVSDGGYEYIDISENFKSDGFLGEEYTSDGYHIKEAYYPFVLNGISQLVK